MKNLLEDMTVWKNQPVLVTQEGVPIGRQFTFAEFRAQQMEARALGAGRENLPAALKYMDKKQLDILDKMTPLERQKYIEIASHEPGITADIKEITSMGRGELPGLEYRLKTPSSTYEKMYGREIPTNLDEMNDVIRYTQVYAADDLAEGTLNTLKALEDKGYTVNKIKNTWNENSAYKGINTTVTSPSGQTFELQFHTQRSYDLKNGMMHKLYEESRVLPTGSLKKAGLDQQMLELSSQLEKPKNIERVVSK